MLISWKATAVPLAERLRESGINSWHMLPASAAVTRSGGSAAPGRASQSPYSPLLSRALLAACPWLSMGVAWLLRLSTHPAARLPACWPGWDVAAHGQSLSRSEEGEML